MIDGTAEETKRNIPLIEDNTALMTELPALQVVRKYAAKLERIEHRKMQYIDMKTTTQIPNMVDLRAKFMPVVD